MPERIRTHCYEDHHFKVRVFIAGAGVMHLASANEPCPRGSEGWQAEWLDDPEKGDTIGFIDWSVVSAITWRWTGTLEDQRGQ